MKSLKNTELVKHHPDTLEVVRKEFDLHADGRMEESVNRLNEWIKAQPHFNKKNFSREYLEVFVINAKGSVEGAKKYIEQLCAYKTFGPEYFRSSIKPIDFKGMETIDIFCMPKLTKEHHRIVFVRNTTQKDYTVEVTLNYLIKTHFMLEYLYQQGCYSLGLRAILDYSKTDIAYFIRAMRFTEARHGFFPFFKGYASRMKSVHFVTPSKMIDVFVSAISQILGEKMFGRIYVHKTFEEVYEHIDKDLLPSDYGGKEKSVAELNAEWEKLMSTDEYMEYIKDMFQATLNPALKPDSNIDDPFLGMQGTFRTISID